jgi:hypothetical protein
MVSPTMASTLVSQSAMLLVAKEGSGSSRDNEGTWLATMPLSLPGWYAALRIEHRTALQEDHLAIHEVGAAAVRDVGEQGAARAADVVGQALG